jgi:hypothetical protein
MVFNAIFFMRGILNTTLCDKVSQRLAEGWWFYSVSPVSSINKTDRHDITEILLKMALNTITLTLFNQQILPSMLVVI